MEIIRFQTKALASSSKAQRSPTSNLCAVRKVNLKLHFSSTLDVNFFRDWFNKYNSAFESVHASPSSLLGYSLISFENCTSPTGSASAAINSIVPLLLCVFGFGFGVFRRTEGREFFRKLKQYYFLCVFPVATKSLVLYMYMCVYP